MDVDDCFMAPVIFWHLVSVKQHLNLDAATPLPLARPLHRWSRFLDFEQALCSALLSCRSA